MNRRVLIALAAIVVVATTPFATGSAATLGVDPTALTVFQVPGLTGPVMTAIEMRDEDVDGRIDLVVVDFSGEVAATDEGDWVLTGVPSGGTLDRVAVDGSLVFLHLATDSTSDPDTAVGDFTVALDDSTGSVVSFAPTAPTDGAGPVPTGLSPANVAGGTEGLMEPGDSLEITFSEAIQGVTGSTAVRQLDMAGEDFLNIAGITNGAVPLGSSEYLFARGKDAGFDSSLVQLPDPATVVVTVAGACSASPQNTCSKLTAGQGAFVYAPAATVTDAAGNPAGGSYTTDATFRLF